MVTPLNLSLNIELKITFSFALDNTFRYFSIGITSGAFISSSLNFLRITTLFNESNVNSDFTKLELSNINGWVFSIISTPNTYFLIYWKYFTLAVESTGANLNESSAEIDVVSCPFAWVVSNGLYVLVLNLSKSLRPCDKHSLLIAKKLIIIVRTINSLFVLKQLTLFSMFANRKIKYYFLVKNCKYSQ